VRVEEVDGVDEVVIAEDTAESRAAGRAGRLATEDLA
jgi:hypothetical protein